MIFISHCSANWGRYEIKENDSSLHCLFCWAHSCDPNAPTVKSVPLILLSVCQSIETWFTHHLWSWPIVLFKWSAQRFNVVKQVVLGKNSQDFSPSCFIFFSQLLIPLNPNFTSLPVMTLPRAGGELQPGKGPRLFHEIFWLLRKSVHFLEPVWDRQCSAVRSRTGIQWPLIHRKCNETHSKSILPQLSTAWVSACLVSVPFPASVRRKCFTHTVDSFACLEWECSCEWFFLKFPVSGGAPLPA